MRRSSPTLGISRTITPEQELQHLSEIADARLDVSEELAWLIGVLAGFLVQLKWDTWIGTIITVFVVYLLVTLPYRRRASEAEDAYFRAAHLGKYSRAGGADA